MQPDPRKLIKKMGFTVPLLGIYDAPDSFIFEPVVKPPLKTRVCLFNFYNRWLKGETLQLTRDNYGCGGCGSALFNVTTRSREEFIKFLVDEEGLKSSHNLMGKWLDHRKQYEPKHGNLFAGQLRPEQYQYLLTVTFFVNPDQLSLLILGANYHSGPGDPPAVIAPFGSGCMELLTLFGSLDTPRAIIGATDIAMRQSLPPDILAFTVTRPMFKQLCDLDNKSFLYKPFWKNLQKARGL